MARVPLLSVHPPQDTCPHQSPVRKQAPSAMFLEVEAGVVWTDLQTATSRSVLGPGAQAGNTPLLKATHSLCHTAQCPQLPCIWHGHWPSSTIGTYESSAGGLLRMTILSGISKFFFFCLPFSSPYLNVRVWRRDAWSCGSHTEAININKLWMVEQKKRRSLGLHGTMEPLHPTLKCTPPGFLCGKMEWLFRLSQD